MLIAKALFWREMKTFDEGTFLEMKCTWDTELHPPFSVDTGLEPFLFGINHSQHFSVHK